MQIVEECDSTVKFKCNYGETPSILQGTVKYYSWHTCSFHDTRRDKQCSLSDETLKNINSICNSSGCYLNTDYIRNDGCFTDTEKIWYRRITIKTEYGIFFNETFFVMLLLLNRAYLCVSLHAVYILPKLFAVMIIIIFSYIIVNTKFYLFHWF